MRKAAASGYRSARQRAGGYCVRVSALRGYTLIEVIVAFAILALAFTLLLGSLSGAARQVRWADDAGRAALHAQSLLADLSIGTPLQPGYRDGEFEAGRYRWVLEIAPYDDPLLPGQVVVDPATPRLLQVSLDMHWGREDDPRNRLQLHSLRLVRPDPVALP